MFKAMVRKLLPVILLLFGVFAGIVIHNSANFVADKHFTLLAQAFLKGDLFVDPVNLPKGDYADFFARQYIFYGPTPGIILMPLVALTGLAVNQWVVAFASIFLTFFGVYKLTRKLGLTKFDSLWLSNFFVFGTVYYFVSLVSISAYLVQALATVFVVFALLEYFGRKRFWVIGILVAIAGVTRINLYVMVAFFVLEILTNHRQKAKQSLLYLMVPIIVSMMFLAAYNWRRFGTVFDSGYIHNASEIETGNNNRVGYFSLLHAPAKLYLMLLAAPDPVKSDKVEYVLKPPYLKANGYGMAIWFTSPLFLYLIKVKKRKYNLSAIVAIVALVLPSLLFSGTGSSQFGYRYSLDFLPLLFVILLSAFEGGLPTFAKVLIVAGVLFDCFYMLSIWNSYPFF